MDPLPVQPKYPALLLLFSVLESAIMQQSQRGREELWLSLIYGGMLELQGNHMVLAESPKMTDSEQSWKVDNSLPSPRNSSNAKTVLPLWCELLQRVPQE